MSGYTCNVCKYIAIDGQAPDNCPVCGAPKSVFLESQDAIKEPQDKNGLTDLEKKHIPVITVIHKCSLIPQGCHDVHVKLGQIQHPMEDKHYIMHIDYYIDKKFIARVHLTPQKCNPAAGLHLKPCEGKIQAIALCNQHGAWFNEAEL